MNFNIRAHVTKIIVGNQCDLDKQRKISTREGQLLAERFNMHFIETSAVDIINIEEVFLLITKLIMEIKYYIKEISANFDNI